MKPEPLKGKIKKFRQCDEYNCGFHEDPTKENILAFVDEDCFRISDVASAVKWLKQELWMTKDIDIHEVLRLINKAFEDVVKE